MKSSHPLQWLQRFAGHVPNLQRRVGKWPVAGLVGAWLSSCTPAAGPATDPGVLPWRGNESAAYRDGHKDGSGDHRAGRGRDPRPAATAAREDYLLGYGDGYRHPDDNPWSRPRARDLGQRHGRQDRLAGRDFNPGRTSSAVPRTVGGDFRAGYRAGWDAAGGPQ